MMRVWKIDPAAQSQPKFSRASLRRKALEVALHPQASALVEEACRLSKSGGFVVAQSRDLLKGLGLLDQAMLLPNGHVACIRLHALEFFLCPDIFSDNVVLRRASQTLLSLLQHKCAASLLRSHICNILVGMQHLLSTPPLRNPLCTLSCRGQALTQTP
jgi:hypothetical protein